MQPYYSIVLSTFTWYFVHVIYIFLGRIQKNWRDEGIRVSYQIKRKRERKRGGVTSPISGIKQQSHVNKKT
jgi:hypothetical protein